MRILLAGTFYPLVGGMERMLDVVAGELAARGHEVQIATLSPAPQKGQHREFPFPVWRRPSVRRLLSLQWWADVALHFGVGLRLGWPAMFSRTPQVVSHQFYYVTPGERRRGREVFKNSLTRWVTNISASRAIAASIPGGSAVIPNCYDENVFFDDERVARDRDLVFVGRLVPLKGVDLLLEAMAHLEAAGVRPTLTIVGDGPERVGLQERARQFGSRVTFVDAQPPEVIAETLRAHRVLVVPSRWNEPFGIVALEGIACGCVVVGSAGGGLPEAIGPCGLTVPNNDPAALALTLRRTLSDVDLRQRLRVGAEAHLRVHRREAIASQYEALLLSACSRRSIRNSRESSVAHAAQGDAGAQ